MASKPKALIVGAGIGGLTAALCLKDAGYEVQIFEQAPQIAEIGAGINLLPPGAKVLHGLGLAGALASATEGNGIQTEGLNYYTYDGKVISQEARGIKAGNPVPQYSIHRAKLHRVLLNAVRDRLGANSVLVNHQFDRFEDTTEGVKVYFRRFEGAAEAQDRFGKKQAAGTESLGPYSGTILVGADGIRSAVRQQLYPEDKAKYTGWNIYRGVVDLPEGYLTGRTMGLQGTGTVVFTHYPIDEAAAKSGRMTLNWGITQYVGGEGDPGEENWSTPAPHSEVDPIMADWKFAEDYFRDQGKLTPEEVVKRTKKISKFAAFDRDPVKRWSFGRVTLLGDAAHPLLPFGSQGAGQSILDAAALGEACKEHFSDPVGSLSKYDAVRCEAAGKVVLQNRLMGPTKVLRVVDEARQQGRWPTDQEITAVIKGYHGLTGVKTDKGATSKL